MGYDFLQEFYKQLPQYKNNTLYITGESYAGHYIPAISYHIWEMNQFDNDNYKIPLRGLAIGNGLTNTEIQNFQFLQVYDAGHMVPMDKPQAASEMLNTWL